MIQPPPRIPVVIILAAGRGERFAASGGTVHKLDALLAGKPVRAHVLDAVRGSGLAWHLVEPDARRPGMGDSIAAGVRATPQASGWLILPADLPLICSDTLRAVALAAPSRVTVPVYQGRRGHPVRFDASCGPALMALSGPQGAAAVMRTVAAADVSLLDVADIGCVSDIDTLDDLREAERLIHQR